MGRTTVASSYFWGVANQTIIQGDGLVGPNLSSVTVGDPNTIRAVFDRAMLQDGYLLRTDNYAIAKTGIPLSALAVFRVLPVSGRQDAVDLIVQDQEAVSYDILAGAAGSSAPIRDAYGNILVSGVGTFTGQAPATIAYTEFYAFAGFETGMNAKTETGWDPDLDPPYLDNQNPYPSQPDLGFTPIIWLDILDSTSGVNELSVWIKIDGAYAWRLGSIQPGFTGTRTTIANGYRYKLQRLSAFPGAYVVTVEVYAEDLAAIPNALSTSYWFSTIGDILPPFLYNRIPAANAGGVAPTASFSFDVLDDYSGVVPESLIFFVNGAMAYNGTPGAWYPPYDGYVGRVEDVVDGYDGYHVRIDHPGLVFPASARIDLRVVASDVQGNVLDETYGFWIEPRLVSAEVGPYEVSLRLLFSGAMKESSLLNAALFSFSDGAYVRKTELVAPNEVRLWVERFQGDGPFTLTVSDTVQDIHDGYVRGAGATIGVFQSEAMFSNTDGMVRSWREQRLVARDSKRAYFASSRGADVFDIQYGERNASRWAQVLDSYGIDAMCLVNSSDAYGFSDSTAPRLGGQSPAPGQTGVPVDTTIVFSVIESITSVETVSLAVYVNGLRVFSGASGGWENNWGGQISVFPQRLDVLLYPPAAFAADFPVYVRVLASDLVGNLLDETYSFTTAA